MSNVRGTLRIQAGQPVAWPVHMQRLAHDCERLGLPLPDTAALIEGG